MSELEFKAFESYAIRASVRASWNSGAQELIAYMDQLGDAELNANPKDVARRRWEVLVHLVNHGTDHRSTILQREFDMPIFDQDFTHGSQDFSAPTACSMIASKPDSTTHRLSVVYVEGLV